MPIMLGLEGMRTMIVIPDHHHAEAKRRGSARDGISLSEYIRRLVGSRSGAERAGG